MLPGGEVKQHSSETWLAEPPLSDPPRPEPPHTNAPVHFPTAPGPGRLAPILGHMRGSLGGDDTCDHRSGDGEGARAKDGAVGSKVYGLREASSHPGMRATRRPATEGVVKKRASSRHIGQHSGPASTKTDALDEVFRDGAGAGGLAAPETLGGASQQTEFDQGVKTNTSAPEHTVIFQQLRANARRAGSPRWNGAPGPMRTWPRRLRVELPPGQREMRLSTRHHGKTPTPPTWSRLVDPPCAFCVGVKQSVDNSPSHPRSRGVPRAIAREGAPRMLPPQLGHSNALRSRQSRHCGDVFRRCPSHDAAN